MTEKYPNTQKLIKAYHFVFDHLKAAWHEAEEKTVPTLKEKLDSAKAKLSELDELSREEIDHIAEYVERDLHDAADYLSETGQDLKGWLKNDLEFAETTFAEIFASMADKTRIELERLAERAREVGEWHTGEITGIGILQCKECGEQLHFDKPGHVPPCPKCHHTKFKKLFSQT